MKAMTRLDYLKEQKSGIILKKNDTRDFLEVVMDRYGDVVTYRVYGDAQRGFYLCER